MKKRKFIRSLLVLSTFLLVGCAGKAKDDKSQNSKTEIRFSTWDSEKDLDKQQDLVNKFNDSQDKIKVTLEAYGSEYDTKITAGMGAGDAPDVMYMWNFPQYYEALEPLNKMIENEGAGYKDNFYQTLWNYNGIDGEVYGIPVGFTTHVVYYNKDLFDNNDVAYPSNNWTWEDFVDTSKKLTNEKEGEVGFALPGKPDPYDFEMYLWGNGTAYTDEQGKLDKNLNSKESIEVFKGFQSMIKNGSAIATEGNGTTEMESGKVGMFINGSWSLESLKEAGINYGIVELPSRNGQDAVSILSSSGLAISKDSKNKEAAFEFIKFWTSEEANESRIEYELPVLKSVVEKHDLENDDVKGPFYQMLVESEGFLPSSFKTDNWTEVSSDLELSFERIFNPSALEKPEEVLNEVVDVYK